MRLSPRDRSPPPAPSTASRPEPRGPLAKRRRESRGMGVAGLVSTVLHIVLVAAFLLELDPRRQGPQPLPPPSFAVVFEGGSDQAPRGAEAPEEAPTVTAEAPPPPPPPAPVPDPAPPAPPVPAPAIAALPPPPPPPAVPQAAPPPPALAAPPTPSAPPPPEPPRVATAPEAAPPPPQPPPARQVETAPPPPTPPPARPVEVAPPPAAPPVASIPPPTPPPAPAATTPPSLPVPPDRPAPAIAALPLPPPAPPATPPPEVPLPPRVAPLDLTDRPPIRLGDADPSRPGAPRRGLDLRPGASLPGPGDVENLRVRGAQAGPDWRNAFRMWLDRNLRYPREAAELNEQGPVTVRITTGADGRVRRVELRAGSRSIFLNHYSQAVFRGAALPPFPPGTAEEEVTIDLTIHYILVRR